MTKKEAIINAALELLTKKGIHNAPMSEIAKAAGTGMGTIYNHFSNKDLLINEIYLKIKKEETAAFLNVDTDKPVKTQFEDHFIILIDFFTKNPLYFNFLAQVQASPIITKENRAQGEKSVALVSILLKKGQEDRIVKDIAIDELLVFIGGVISGYLRWYFNSSNKQALSFKNQIRMIWDAIKE